MAVTFDVGTLGPHLAASDGGLTLTSTWNPAAAPSYPLIDFAYATNSQATGKVYFEIEMDYPPDGYVDGQPVWGAYPVLVYVGLVTPDGNKEFMHAALQWDDTHRGFHYYVDVGSRMQVAADLDAGVGWVGVDGVWLGGDPASNYLPAPSWTPGSVTPYVCVGPKLKVTGRFAAASFAHAPPYGFSALGDTAVFLVPDRLSAQVRHASDLGALRGANLSAQASHQTDLIGQPIIGARTKVPVRLFQDSIFQARAVSSVACRSRVSADNPLTLPMSVSVAYPPATHPSLALGVTVSGPVSLSLPLFVRVADLSTRQGGSFHKAG